jgi:hypothetical protein
MSRRSKRPERPLQSTCANRTNLWRARGAESMMCKGRLATQSGSSGWNTRPDELLLSVGFARLLGQNRHGKCRMPPRVSTDRRPNPASSPPVVSTDSPPSRAPSEHCLAASSRPHRDGRSRRAQGDRRSGRTFVELHNTALGAAYRGKAGRKRLRCHLGESRDARPGLHCGDSSHRLRKQFETAISINSGSTVSRTRVLLDARP